MRRGDRDADSVASGDSKRSWGMGRGVTPIGDAASGRSARGDAVSESAASASSTGSWMRKGTRRLASPPLSAVDPLRSNARGAPRAVSRFARSDGTIDALSVHARRTPNHRTFPDASFLSIHRR